MSPCWKVEEPCPAIRQKFATPDPMHPLRSYQQNKCRISAKTAACGFKLYPSGDNERKPGYFRSKVNVRELFV
jgi:hypothetical protein